MRGSSEPMRARSPYPGWDRFFVIAFSLFVLVAFVHEPLFYWHCGWNGLRTGVCTSEAVKAIWVGYAQYDPVYFDMPLWMALMIGFDSVLLSPFYVYAVWALATGRADTPLFRTIASTVCGGLIYAMVLYMTWEVMEAETYSTDLLMVTIYNIPWGLVPLGLVIRLHKGLSHTAGEEKAA